MKSFAAILLFLPLLGAQAPPQVQVAPGTPAVGSPAPSASASSAPIAPDTPVLEVNGKKYTAAEVDKMIASLPPQFQQTAHAQPQMLSQLFLMLHLAEDAEKAGLDKQAPYKDAIEFSRMQVLSQAELTILQATVTIPKEDQEKYYKEHPEKFKEAKVRVIYVAFNPTPDKPAPNGKTLLTEAEARTKITELRQQIVAGADFGKLARENSDDKASAAKDGDFGTITQKSTYPAPIKTAVFALKQGEVSEPVKQANGYYLIRADEVSTPSFDEVAGQILQDMKQEHFGEMMKGMQAQYTVKVEDPAYFTAKEPAKLQQVR